MDSEGQTTIRVRDCACPGTPHEDGDYVYLAPELSMTGGMAAQGAITAATTDKGIDAIILQEELARVWLRHGAIGWNLLDERGRSRPFTPEGLIVEFPYMRGGREIADACDDLYKEAVLTPLVERLSALSKRGPTEPIPLETSRTKRSTAKPRKRSSTANTGKGRATA